MLSRKKILTQEIATRKNFGPTNTHEKFLDPRNNHEKNFLDPRNTHERKFWNHEVPTKARWHDGTKPTRLTIAHSHEI